MNFAELLNFYSFVIPLCCVLWDGWKHHKAFGVSVGLPIGFTLGFACFYGTRGLVRWIVTHPQLGKSDASPVWVFASWGLLLGVIVWISAATWAGVTLTERVVVFGFR